MNARDAFKITKEHSHNLLNSHTELLNAIKDAANRGDWGVSFKLGTNKPLLDALVQQGYSYTVADYSTDNWDVYISWKDPFYWETGGHYIIPSGNAL